MAIPLGFGLGDICVVISLVRDLYACIGSNGRVSREITKLLANVQTLYTSVIDLNSVILDENVPIAEATERALEHHLKQCRILMEQLLSRTTGITGSLPKRSFGATIKNTSTRIKFEFDLGSNNIRELNQRFHVQVEAFRAYSSIEFAARQQGMHQSLESIRASHKRISSNLEQLLRMWGDMPRELGFTWTGSEMKAMVTLVQASGESRPIPLEACETPERFKKFLLLEPRYPGRKRVELGHFELTNSSTGKAIDLKDGSEWNRIVRPGSKLLLSVMVATAIYAKMCNDICPRCHSKRLSNLPLHPWKKCSDCELEHRKTTYEDWGHEEEAIDSDTWDYFPVRERLPPGHPAAKRESEGRPSFCRQEEIDSHWVDQDTKNLASDPKASAEEENDLEQELKRVVIIHSPIWNFVYRNSVCLCRLDGDSSPYAPDFDFTIFSICRLHVFDEAVTKFGLDPKHPAEGYDPRQDPYFARFGGYLAFALFICDHPLVMRSIDVRKLIRDDEWEAAGIEYRHAQANNCCWAELLRYKDQLGRDYFRWRKEYKEKQTKAMGAKPEIVRRGSF